MRSYVFGTTTTQEKRNIIIACGVIIVFMVLVSLTVDDSPLSTAYPNIDSGVFQYIGAHILQGQMPYLDFFDHKGPTLYLINAAAAFIAPGGFGLYLVETLFLIVAALVSYFTCRRFSGDFTALVAVVVAYSALASFLWGGNYVEQYALLFAAVSLFCFSSYFVKGHLASWEAFAIGFCAACVLFLRPNLLGAWAIFCIAILVFMVRDGKAKDIPRIVLFALGGFACFLVPILAWLVIGGAFPDFVDQYLVFNMEYSATYTWSDRIDTFFWMVGNQPMLVVVLGTGIYATARSAKEKRRFWACLLGATILTVMLASMSGREYVYYQMAWVPYAPLPFAFALARVAAYTKEQAASRRGRSVVAVIVTIALIGVCFIPNILNGYGSARTLYFAHDAEDMEGRGGVVRTVLALTEPSDKLIVGGAECWVYNETGRSAATKYIFQPDDTRLVIRNELLFEDIQANRPKLVVIPTNYNPLDALQGLPGYLEVFRNDSFMVFALQE